MKYYLIIIFLCTSFFANAQGKLEKIAQEIEAEGRALYRLEKAAWIGTDILREDHKELMSKLGGYIAYDLGNEVHCIFYDRNRTAPQVVADVIFDPSFQSANTKVDQKVRNLTALEQNLVKARAVAQEYIQNNDFFVSYKNTNPNLVAVMTKKGAKVTVLTGPSVQGVVVLGNDYEIIIDKKWKVKTATKIHNNIIPISFSDDQKDGVTLHSHLKSTGKFITPTDICTLLLYGDYTGWKQHIVKSEKYVSIWDFKKKSLLIMTSEALDKIKAHMESK